MFLRNVWLVLRREYIERVRTKAFVISTVLVPIFMFAVTVLPQKFALMRTKGTRNIVVVAGNQRFVDILRQQLTSSGGRKFNITLDQNSSDAERTSLRSRLTNREIDGFLWVTDENLSQRKVTYAGRETSDFLEMANIQKAVTMAAMESNLEKNGIAAAKVEEMLKPIHVDTVRVQAGKESRLNGAGAFAVAFGMVMFLYMILIMYGVMVMQSVLEEKSSRIIEVLLATVKSTELMMGKILGVGAAGLTQVLIWVGAAAIFSAPALTTLASMGIEIEIPIAIVIAFPVFFLLGFLLYSANFAAVGAAVNSIQEAQQFNFIVMSPIILSITMMMYVVRQPSAPISVAMSIFPFTAPILMFLRIAVQQPPAWQIALSISMLILTVFAMMVLCARIYRVGILMYGKRPNLPEIIKWLRYA